MQLKITKCNIGVIGVGYWGQNLVRNFYELGVVTVQPLRHSLIGSKRKVQSVKLK